MNLRKQIALSIAIVTLLGLTAAGASAETILRGTFELPAQAYWGNTLLPQGQYTMVMNKGITGVGLISLRGEGVNTTFIAPAVAGDDSGKSRLKLESVNGTYVVREFDASALNKAYRFSVPKSVRAMAVSQNAAPPVTVSVNSANGL